MKGYVSSVKERGIKLNNYSFYIDFTPSLDRKGGKTKPDEGMLMLATRSTRRQLLHLPCAHAWWPWAGWPASALLPCWGGSGVASPAPTAQAEGSHDRHLLSLRGLMIQVLMYFLVGCRSNKERGRWKSNVFACLPPRWLQERAPGGTRGEAGQKVWQVRTGRWPPPLGACVSSAHGQLWSLLLRAPPTPPSSSSLGLNLAFLHFVADA